MGGAIKLAGGGGNPIKEFHGNWPQAFHVSLPATIWAPTSHFFVWFQFHVHAKWNI